MRHFALVDAGQALPERRWQVWKLCVADGRPDGCLYDLFCDCFRTEAGALAELVSEHASRQEAAQALRLRQLDLERFDGAIFQEMARRRSRRD